MNLRKTISKEGIVLDLKSDTKDEVLEELVDLLVQVGRIQDRKTVMKAILDREKKMSTGMQNGIACDSITSGTTDWSRLIAWPMRAQPEEIIWVIWGILTGVARCYQTF